MRASEEILREAARYALGYIRTRKGSTYGDIAIRQLEEALGEAVTRGLVTAEEKEAPTVRAVGKREAGTWTVTEKGTK